MRKTAGFTLVELLVVVIVIGILAGVAVMHQRGLTSRARVAAAAADARSIREAEATFHADSGRYADLATLTSAGYAPQPSRGNQFRITLEGQGYLATVAIDEGQGGGGGGGGCRLQVGPASDALACSARGVPGSSSGEVPGVRGVAPPSP
jgi:prepilin-type N-terminal cleavage/methylation domain-containing protein